MSEWSIWLVRNLQELGAVLTVRVELDERVVVVPRRVLESRAHRGADTEIDGVAKHPHAGRGGDLRGAIARAVVDHDDVLDRMVIGERMQDRPDRRLLVVRGDRDQHAASRLRRHRRTSA